MDLNSQRPVRVMIVEDSSVERILLENIVEADDRLELVASCGSGEKALETLEQLRPDVISMDVFLPGKDGLETTRQIMSQFPIPIVIASHHYNSEELNLSFNALKAGALCVLEKPYGPAHPDFQKRADHFCTQLVIMSKVKVIKHRRRLADPLKAVAPPVVAPAASKSTTSKGKILGIVASTGGPKALLNLLNALGPDFPLPVLIVQHISASFFEGFQQWLNSLVPQTVVAAQGGESPQSGCVYLAPPDVHLVYRQHQLVLQESEAVSYQKPSGTVMLESLAHELGDRAMGVILTGMGDDGAKGLLALYQAGGYTIAESEATATVYGMPCVAATLNAAKSILPLDEIGPHLRSLVMRSSSTR